MQLSSTTQTDPALGQLIEKIGKTFDVDFEPLQVDNATLDTLNIRNMKSHLDRLVQSGAVHNPLRDLPLWARVWPSSFVLGRFLRNMEPQGKSLLEIGCGMGICGLVASQYGFASIVMGDVSREALDFARANVLRNGLEERLKVRYLDVANSSANGDFSSRFDIIAASEILYLDELHRPLLKFLNRHLKKGGKALFCTDLARVKPRFQKLASQNFHIQEGNLRVKNTGETGEEEKRVYNILILEQK